VAPPKRKTGGRVTAAGTRPGDKPAAAHAKSAGSGDEHRYESGRYTAPTSRALEQSPQWVPILMLSLFAIGGLAIMARYLWWDSNIPMVLGMVALLAGLFTATKWR
jgi:hypothetical protein